MPTKAKILGAGSIGNHLAQACRRAGWDVSMVDTDPKALSRMKEEIYPKRYGEWDDGIRLYTLEKSPKGGFDVIFIGTPPDVHISLARQILKEEAPKVLQIEKPLCPPTLEGVPEFLKESEDHADTAIVVGYDHILGENTQKAEEYIANRNLGNIQTLDCEFRSHWQNIFDAHPWLSGPQDTYLGFWKRGGGAGGEHSHALNLWQHFAHVVRAGKVKEVTATFDFVEKDGALYDKSCFINLVTENNIVGRVAQDVITLPKKKFLNFQFENGSLEWDNDVTKTLDKVSVHEHGKEKEVIDIEKTRPDEFFREIMHIQKILTGKISVNDSPIRLERALDTIYVLEAAHRSYKEKKVITVEYKY